MMTEKEKKMCVLCGNEIQVPENYRDLNEDEKKYPFMQSAFRVYGKENCFLHNNCGDDLAKMAGVS
jgi:hypothetical protein